MKSLKQIKADPRIYEVTLNSDWSPELAEDYSDDHPSKYLMYLNDGYVFSDDSTFIGADTVKQLSDYLNDIRNTKIYKADYENGREMVFNCDNDKTAIEWSKSAESIEGTLLHLFEVNGDINEIRTVI